MKRKQDVLKFENVVSRDPGGSLGFDAIEKFELILNNSGRGLFHAMKVGRANSMGREVLYKNLLGHIKPAFGSITFNEYDITKYTQEQRRKLGILGFYYDHEGGNRDYFIRHQKVADTLLFAMGKWRYGKEERMLLEEICEKAGFDKELTKVLDREVPENGYIGELHIPYTTLVAGLALSHTKFDSNRLERGTQKRMFRPTLNSSAGKKYIPPYQIYNSTKLLILGQPLASNYGYGQEAIEGVVNYHLNEGVNVFRISGKDLEGADHRHYFLMDSQGYITNVTDKKHKETEEAIEEYLKKHNLKQEPTKYKTGDSRLGDNYRYEGSDNFKSKISDYLSLPAKIRLRQKHYGFAKDEYTRINTIKNLSFEKFDIGQALGNYYDRQNGGAAGEIPLGFVSGDINYIDLYHKDMPVDGHMECNIYLSTNGILSLLEGKLKPEHIRVNKLIIKGDGFFLYDFWGAIGGSCGGRYSDKAWKYHNIMQLKSKLVKHLVQEFSLLSMFHKDYMRTKAAFDLGEKEIVSATKEYYEQVRKAFKNGNIPGTEFYKHIECIEGFYQMRNEGAYLENMVLPERTMFARMLASAMSKEDKKHFIEIGVGDGSQAKEICKQVDVLNDLQQHYFDVSPIMGLLLHDTMQGKDGVTFSTKNFFDAKELHQEDGKIIVIGGALVANLDQENGELHDFLTKSRETMQVGDHILIGVPGEQSEEQVMEIYESDAMIRAWFNKTAKEEYSYEETIERTRTFTDGSFRSALKVKKPFTYKLGGGEEIQVEPTVLYGIPSRRAGRNFYREQLLKAGFVDENMVAVRDSKSNYLCILCKK